MSMSESVQTQGHAGAYQVEALRYKLKIAGWTPGKSIEFFFNAPSPSIRPSSDRNVYHKLFWKVERGRHLRERHLRP
jgi:hypothetical protein